MRVTEEAEASGLNSKMAGAPELATCGVLSAAQIRPPAGLIGAAQHPGIERRAIIPAAFQFHCETARYHTAACNDPWPARPNGDETIACGLTPIQRHR